MMAQDSGTELPMVEAKRHILEYYNKGVLMKHVDKVGYFIMGGVAICEEGKKEEVLEMMHQATRDIFQVAEEEAERRAEEKAAAKAKRK